MIKLNYSGQKLLRFNILILFRGKKNSTELDIFRGFYGEMGWALKRGSISYFKAFKLIDKISSLVVIEQLLFKLLFERKYFDFLTANVCHISLTLIESISSNDG